MQHLLDKSTCRYITIIINALMREMWAYNIYKWYNHFIFTFRLHQTEYCTPVCIRYRYSIETNQFCYYEIECWTLCAFSMNLNKFRNLFGETLRGVDPYIYSSLIERFNSAYYEFISHNVVVFFWLNLRNKFSHPVISLFAWTKHTVFSIFIIVEAWRCGWNLFFKF